MRVTKVATTRSCAVCERTLLMGERAVSFAPTEGGELVDVCPLCQELAIEAGWIKEGAPTTPTLDGGRRRRRKSNLGEILGLPRAVGRPPSPSQAQPRRVPRPHARVGRGLVGTAGADPAPALRRRGRAAR